MTDRAPLFGYPGDITVTLPGLPRGKGRPRFARRGKFVSTYTDEKTASYEGALRLAGADAMRGEIPMVGALWVHVTAVFPIPASWSRKKREAAEQNQVAPTGKPDCDNLLKCLDAFNEIVWKDDAQIVSATVVKVYGTQPMLRVAIGRLS